MGLVVKKSGSFFAIVFVSLFALSIPGLLILNGLQSRKYTDLKDEILTLEKKEEKLIEENKKLITDISVLSSSQRIEEIAQNELGMRKAESDEIVRVDMKGNKK